MNKIIDFIKKNYLITGVAAIILVLSVGFVISSTGKKYHGDVQSLNTNDSAKISTGEVPESAPDSSTSDSGLDIVTPDPSKPTHAPDVVAQDDSYNLLMVGSDLTYDLVNSCYQGFKNNNSKIKSVVSPTKESSEDGIKKFKEGDADIAMVSRPLTDSEKSLGFKEFNFAFEPFIVLKNTQNKVDNLSMDDLKRIYKGEIKNWKDVGGEDAPIKALFIDDSNGSTMSAFKYKHTLELLDTYDKDAYLHRNQLLPTAKATSIDSQDKAKDAVIKDKNSIAFLTFKYFDDTTESTIDALKINGITPNLENIKSEKYPLQVIAKIITKNAVKPSVKEFIDFAMSNKGKNLIFGGDNKNLVSPN